MFKIELSREVPDRYYIWQTYLMPGEEFIRQGDIGRELGFVAGGVLDIIQGDTGAVVRSVYGDNLDIPSVVGEIAFFLSSAQPFKVRALPPLLRCCCLRHCKDAAA